MSKYFGIALMTSALLVQTQLQVCAQSTDQVDSKMPLLHPPISSTLDSGQTTTQSPSPMPFTTSSPYSYSEPAATASSNYDIQPAVAAPLPVTSSSRSAAMPPKTTKQKRHGFSPVGAVLGMPGRAVKTSLGLTDRTAKTGLGATGKSTKEVFKAVF